MPCCSVCDCLLYAGRIELAAACRLPRVRSLRQRRAVQPAGHRDFVIEILDDIVRFAIKPVRRFVVVCVLMQGRQSE